MLFEFLSPLLEFIGFDFPCFILIAIFVLLLIKL